MLDGIHVLNRTVVTEAPVWALVVMVGGIVALLVGVVLAGDALSDIWEVIWIIVAVIGFISFIGVGMAQPEVETDRYRYEVTVGPYVRFTDIYERYDVVERRGEIWVLEDKEVNE